MVITYKWLPSIYKMNQILDQQGGDVSRSSTNKGVINDIREFGLDPESNGEPLKDLRKESE